MNLIRTSDASLEFSLQIERVQLFIEIVKEMNLSMKNRKSLDIDVILFESRRNSIDWNSASTIDRNGKQKFR